MPPLTASFRRLFAHFNYRKVHSPFADCGHFSFLLAHRVRLWTKNAWGKRNTWEKYRHCCHFQMWSVAHDLWLWNTQPEQHLRALQTVGFWCQTGPDTSLYSKTFFFGLLNYQSTAFTATSWLSGALSFLPPSLNCVFLAALWGLLLMKWIAN